MRLSGMTAVVYPREATIQCCRSAGAAVWHFPVRHAGGGSDHFFHRLRHALGSDSEFAMKRSVSIGDGNAAVMIAFTGHAAAGDGAVVVCAGRNLSGHRGRQDDLRRHRGNSFNPVAVAVAILGLSWGNVLDFSEAMSTMTSAFRCSTRWPRSRLFGVSAVSGLNAGDLMMGKQIGGTGATRARTDHRRHLPDHPRNHPLGDRRVLPGRRFCHGHRLQHGGFIQIRRSGFSPALRLHLIGAFFLATEDSSSPVNRFLHSLWVACRLDDGSDSNIGAYVDGVIYAILVANLLSPVLDKIRPSHRKGCLTCVN